jgi:hypothetical protein
VTDKKSLTREEEADEIIRRLATPPAPRPRRIEAEWTFEVLDSLGTFGIDLEAELSEVLAAEIDKEIIEELRKKYGKGNT